MPREFREIRLLVKDIKKDVERGMKGLMLEITANLRRAASEGGTPVDTGFARANWIPEVGKSHEGTAGTREEAEAGTLDTSMHKKGLGSLLSYKLIRGRIYITNNVHYIVLLNEGSSAQAPAGFVQSAIERALVSLERGLFR
jgi:hypothetical protein